MEKKLIIDCLTGEESIVDMTAEEITAKDNANKLTYKDGYKTIDEEQEAKKSIKASAKAKLVAGEPLTEAEADTLVI